MRILRASLLCGLTAALWATLAAAASYAVRVPGRSSDLVANGSAAWGASAAWGLVRGEKVVLASAAWGNARAGSASARRDTPQSDLR
jgi:hypothetical protein